MLKFSTVQLASPYNTNMNILMKKSTFFQIKNDDGAMCRRCWNTINEHDNFRSRIAEARSKDAINVSVMAINWQ